MPILYFTCNSTFWLDDIMVTSSLLSDVRLVTSLLISSNDGVSSFCWTRGSKHGSLTTFSNFSCYFLILGSLCSSCYFLASLHLFWLHGILISLSCFLIPYALWGSMLYICPHASGTGPAVSLGARLLWDPGSRLSTRLFSHFHSLPKISNANVDHTFLMNKAVLILIQRWT